jgi:uncharacterized protein (TIGR02145 family)/uncharacterized repeat protein (TIGR02543 family)
VKIITFFILILGILINCTHDIAGNLDETKQGTLFGKILSNNGSKIEGTVTVSLYKESNTDTVLIKTIQSSNGTYEFDSLEGNEYSVVVTKDSIVIGSQHGIKLQHDNRMNIDIIIVIIINQVINVSYIDNRQYQTINNIIFTNNEGAYRKENLENIISFAETDTLHFKLVLPGRVDTVNVAAIKNADGTYSIKTIDTSIVITISPILTPPLLSFDSASLYKRDKDTIAGDSIRIIITPRSDSLNVHYRWKLDKGDWYILNTINSSNRFITLNNISSGQHTVTVEANNTIDTVDTSLTFFIAEKPLIIAHADSLMRPNEGESCTLWVAVKEVDKMEYQWYRNSIKIESSDNDTLIITTLSPQHDNGNYTCELRNKWGRQVSDTMKVFVTPIYSLSYNGNGSDNGTVPAVARYLQGAAAIISDNTGNLVKKGNYFSGWNTASDGSEASYLAGKKLTIRDQDVTLYAQWTPGMYSVTFNKNSDGAGGTMPSQSIKFNDSANLTSNGFTRSNYSFAGWAGSAGGSVEYVNEARYIMKTEGATLFAKWKPLSYTIQYHLNNGQNGSNPADYTIESPIITLANASRSGYVFDGWYSDEGFTSRITQIPTGSTGNRDLWAKWLIRDIDGNTYTEVKIGNQVWMVENLKTTKYNDGSEIPMVAGNTDWGALSSPGYCWYANDISNKEPYGALYNWHAVNTGKLAPAGWRVSGYADWIELRDFLISNGYNYDGTTTDNKIAKSLASTSLWGSNNGAGAIGNVLSQNNRSGFNGYPNGFRGSPSGTFDKLGAVSNWWTTTENGANATRFGMATELITLYVENDDKRYGFAVRCIRN